MALPACPSGICQPESPTETRVHACVPGGPVVLLLQCYKAVPLLMEKQLRRSSSGVQRANAMYAVSKVLRSANKELKGKSKYGECQGGSGLGAAAQQQSMPQLNLFHQAVSACVRGLSWFWVRVVGHAPAVAASNESACARRHWSVGWGSR